MRVKMLVPITGTRNGVDWPPIGGEVDLPEVEARHLVDGGLAVEVAVAPAPEKAAAPKARAAKPKAAETR